MRAKVQKIRRSHEHGFQAHPLRPPPAHGRHDCGRSELRPNHSPWLIGARGGNGPFLGGSSHRRGGSASRQSRTYGALVGQEPKDLLVYSRPQQTADCHVFRLGIRRAWASELGWSYARSRGLALGPIPSTTETMYPPFPAQSGDHGQSSCLARGNVYRMVRPRSRSGFDLLRSRLSL